MGRRGPPPTPTRILELRGSWRAKVREGEPQPERKRPRCPAWLPKAAKSIWRDLVPQLDRMGVLGRCDRNTLARYCQLFVRWLQAEREANVERSIRLSEHLLRLEREFGLTPSARANMAHMKVNPDENRGKARFFNAKTA